MRISVIVPIYNAEQTLRRCVDSILSQTFSDFELILVDDGSKDGSLAICEEYALADNRVQVIHKENGGASSARNAGLEVAKGEWITFCDSDDFVRPYWLSSFVDNMEGVEMVVQGIDVNPESQEFLVGKQFYDGKLGTQKALDNLMQNSLLGYTPCKAFKREIIEANHLMFDIKFKLREDNLFVLEYFKYVNSVGFTSNRGYFYFVPEWGRKYASESTNEFYEWMKEYEIVKSNPKVDTNSLSYYKVLQTLAGFVFEEYAKARNGRYSKLRQFIHKASKDIRRLEGVSYLTILVCRMPVPIAHIILSFKAVKKCRK